MRESKRQRVVNVTVRAALAAAVLLGPLGCGSSPRGPSDFAVAGGAYPAAFDATRDVLQEYGFALERIDAAAGVISTEPEFSPGLLEPWSPVQTGLADEWEDTVNHQSRVVRVTFAPVGEPPAGAADPDFGEPMRASVWVTVYRQHRVGRRLDSEWVGASSFYDDPEFRMLHGTTYEVATRRDRELEARLAREIEARITPEPAPEPDPEPEPHPGQQGMDDDAVSEPAADETPQD